MPRLPDSSAGRRVQYAALPYRQRQDGEVQVRLITSRETRRWVLPKGWPMKDIAPHKAAAREAFEEAGLIGSMSRTAVGLYTYEKRLSPVRSVTCDVMVFPMKVKRYLKKWPERSQRIGFWFTVESAAAAVQEEELKDLILRFGAIMADRFAAKQAAKEAKAREARAAEGAKALVPKAKAAAKGEAHRIADPMVPENGVASASVQGAAGIGANDVRAADAPVTAAAKGPRAKAQGKGSAGAAPVQIADERATGLGAQAKGKGGKGKGARIALRDVDVPEAGSPPVRRPTTH